MSDVLSELSERDQGLYLNLIQNLQKKYQESRILDSLNETVAEIKETDPNASIILNKKLIHAKLRINYIVAKAQKDLTYPSGSSWKSLQKTDDFVELIVLLQNEYTAIYSAITTAKETIVKNR